ncbi:hypothetical protein EXU29_04295 [Acinetobacter wuhouensis]|uniref:hypothetical protein n=1 Tax=Acinetobacter wuhouensis TaxID=1879050 RepID=UPI001022E22F|nr:hypothetical protein [Acinetobacter wuhouensis]RZG74613.1 hypothetical protein EXU29_04295 [Acinetobacter wuhouensis]
MSDKDKFMQENGISNNFGLTVKGLSVNEFSYLLQHYSEGKVVSFDNLDLVLKYKDEVMTKIQKDLNKDDKDLPESVLTVNARYNLENLTDILNILNEYNQKIGTLTFFK